MSTVLYFDCFSGASGDMLLGAFLDAGLPLDALREALGTLALDGVDVAADRVTRSGISATKFRVIDNTVGADPCVGPILDPRVGPIHRAVAHARHDHAGDDHDHGHHGHDHDHDHHPHVHGDDGAHVHADHANHDDHEDNAAGHPPAALHHRSLDEIGRLIDRSALSPAGRARARELFLRLGETEADIHQIPLDRVHLHEVGAIDSIIDIVGAVFALEWFGADRIVASPLNVGGGTVRCDHGLLPVPAPATARLLRGVPIYSRGDTELVTPTGALIVTAYAAAYGPLPAMAVDRIGYGAGEREIPDRPNVLRVFVGQETLVRDAERHHERIAVLQCEIDDMNPQIFGLLMDRLLEAGALDVFYQPVQMKKNRPGTLVTVLTPLALRETLTSLLFAESTSIGIRFFETDRECLARERVEVATAWGVIGVKVARRGGVVLNAQPEFDDCARIAASHHVPLKQVQAAAMSAWLETGG